MKKMLALLALFGSILAGVAQTPNTPNTDWYNTSTNVFTLSTAAELAGLAKLVNEGHAFEDTTIRLDAPGNVIDLTSWLAPTGGGYDGGAGWTPIGTSSSLAFNGTFDGQGDTIKGLWIDRTTTDNVGLFGYIESLAKIKNLTVKIDAGTAGNPKGVKGQNLTGSLVGLNIGEITNCAALPMEGSTGTMVTGTGDYTGGLVGYNTGSISNCYATGAVKGDRFIGGLVGHSQSTLITNCYATGTVEGNQYIGGLTGYNLNTLIINCYATGVVTGSSYTGGLVGESHATITNCYATGTVTGNGLKGGLAGSIYRDITTCYFLNTSATYGIGSPEGSPDGEASPLTDDELKLQASFNSWDFTTVWGISSTINNGYPYLQVLRDSYTEVIPTPDPDPQPTSFAVTLMADEGINLLPSAGTHGATIGGSFTFYVTLAEGFEGQTPQATVNGDPVTLTLRPSGTEWMYVIPQVYDDTRVVVSFSTTANDPASGARLYTCDGRLFIETPQPAALTVYAPSGQITVSRRLAEGLTTLPLPRGIYLVKLDDRVERIVVK